METIEEQTEQACRDAAKALESARGLTQAGPATNRAMAALITRGVALGHDRDGTLEIETRERVCVRLQAGKDSEIELYAGTGRYPWETAELSRSTAARLKTALDSWRAVSRWRLSGPAALTDWERAAADLDGAAQTLESWLNAEMEHGPDEGADGIASLFEAVRTNKADNGSRIRLWARLGSPENDSGGAREIGISWVDETSWFRTNLAWEENGISTDTPKLLLGMNIEPGVDADTGPLETNQANREAMTVLAINDARNRRNADQGRRTRYHTSPRVAGAAPASEPGVGMEQGGTQP